MNFKFPGDSFICYKDVPPPAPGPSGGDIPEPKNTDQNVGKYCSKSEDCSSEDDESDVK